MCVATWLSLGLQISMLWGVFFWKEFEGVTSRVHLGVCAVLLLYAGAIALIALSS